MRMREWYAVDDADLDGDQRDVLDISTDGERRSNALPPFVGNGAIGIHVHDDAATPGATTLVPLPYFSEQPFQSGVDVFMPASPDGIGHDHDHERPARRRRQPADAERAQLAVEHARHQRRVHRLPRGLILEHFA